jgi:hypothetical protein
MKTLEKDPNKRYPSASDFAMALKGCLSLDDEALRSVPQNDESQRFFLQGQQAAHAEIESARPPPAKPEPVATRPVPAAASAAGTAGAKAGASSAASAPAPAQSPVLWAALGAGATLLLGALAALAFFLMRD